jgi:hypothetical protein
MILQRAFEAILSALGWLVDLLFPRTIFLTALFCLAVGAAAVLVALLIMRRYRARRISLAGAARQRA